MELNLLFWGLSIGVVGKVLLGVAVLRVHGGIMKEHRIDGVVLRAIKKERWVTLVGIGLILLGYVLELIFFGYTPLLVCSGAECAALMNASF